MKYHIFRNHTIEPFFKGWDVSFSGYGDISIIEDQKMDAYIWWYQLPYKVNNDIIIKEIENYESLLSLAITNLIANKPVIIFTLQSIFKIDYISSDYRIEKAIYEHNQKLESLAAKNKHIKIVDISGFYNHYSQEQLIDWKFYYLSQMPLNPKLSKDFQTWFNRQVEITEMKRKKCVVLDLDNTLWGGILGEDGLEGIKMGESYPGNAYRSFQEYLLELHRKGIILTICSKNNEKDVIEVWNIHPDIILKKEHITTYRINWNNKADNIKSIAEELNIGLDSLVFIDDNPAERELIKQLLPEIAVPDFPNQPYDFSKWMDSLTYHYFSTYRLTEEDLAKTLQYKENMTRKQMQSEFSDFDSYLKSLEIELTIEPANEINIVRMAQLTQKTNQFNLTTHRYTESDIQNFIDNNFWIYGLRVKDKFGDNGLTGLIIIEIENNQAYINTFLLSCRILGRKIEDEFLKYMLIKLKNTGVEVVKSDYIKTLKNSQVENFYERFHFEIDASSDQQKSYSLNLKKANNIVLSNTYKLIT